MPLFPPFKQNVNTIPFSVLPTSILLATMSHNGKNISKTHKYKRILSLHIHECTHSW